MANQQIPDREIKTLATSDLWLFSYKRGMNPHTGIVRGKDEATGYEVARRWCELEGIRPPAKVYPMVLANESILKQPVPTPDAIIVEEKEPAIA